jgi:protoheme IX farnesyltransferase
LLKQFVELTKPERTLANVITALAGFLLACRWHIPFLLLAATLVGTSLVVASACVLNNYIDRELDTKMPRTKKRVLAVRAMSPRSVLVYAVVLGVIGFAVLWLYVSMLVVILGAIAYFDYIVLYGYSKRHSVHSTLIGTVSGAMPIMAGYCAVTGTIDMAAVLLFFSMVFWQMPHFYAIAIFRMKDYAAGGIPVLPLKKGVYRTKVQMLCYMLAFIFSALLLRRNGYVGTIYTVVIAAVGVLWMWRGVRGFNVDNDVAWARHMFFYSLKALMIFSVMVAIGSILP